MKEQTHHERQMLPVPAEKRLLVMLALFSLLCHVVVLVSLHHYQGIRVPDHLPPVITVDLQTVASSAGQSGPGAEQDLPAPRPVSSRKIRTQMPIEKAPGTAKPQHKATPVVPSGQQSNATFAAAVEQAKVDTALPTDAVFTASTPSGTHLPFAVTGTPSRSLAAATGSSDKVEGRSVIVEQKAPGAGYPGDAARARYLEQVKKLIEKRLDYPLMARKVGLQGVVLIRCQVTRDGSPVAVEVARASSHPLLDLAALRSVARVGRFPAVPAEVAGEVVDLTIPLRFSLGERRYD